MGANEICVVVRCFEQLFLMPLEGSQDHPKRSECGPKGPNGICKFQRLRTAWHDPQLANQKLAQ